MKRYGILVAATLLILAFTGCSDFSLSADDFNPTIKIRAITLLSIPGVIAPVTGASPVTTAIDTAQYTGTITWDPATDPFAVLSAYTANIILTAKTGWTLSGVAANSFTVSGATATHPAGSGVVSAVFPATGVQISLLSIPGVVAPATGASPVTTAIDTAQYTGIITWDPATDPFAALTVYTANIALTAKTGWSLSGVAANSFTVSGATVTHAAGSGIVSAVFPATGVQINLLAIPGVVAPVTGASPATTIDTAQYSGTITWDPAADPFAASTVYTANIVLTAKTGWTLSSVAANSFTVSGATATHAADSGTVSAVFPATNARITLLAIPGVVAPATGASPVTTAIDTAQYSGTVAWDPVADPFAASAVYTANIALTAKTGWTLSGVAANSFTVSGATVTHAAGSGIVSAVFPATGVQISLLAIPGVTAPAAGKTPATTAINTAQYTGTIVWAPVAAKFAEMTVYTANIALTAKTGWTLLGVAANSFTVAGATATNAAGSGNVAAVFPATSYTVYAIGDTGPSGVGKVFYVSNGGRNGLEAAPISWHGGASDPIAQSKTTDTASPGTGTAIGTGYTNTYTALAGANHPAAALCRAYSGGGRTDWFLPSLDEMAQMYYQKTVINASGFFYQSSSDYLNPSYANQVYVNKFALGWNPVNGIKTDSSWFSVRPIRAF